MRRTCIIMAMAWLALSPGRADEHVVQTFTGNDLQATTPLFSVGDGWEVRWGPQPAYMSVTVLGSNGAILAGASAMQPGSLYLPRGGTYQLVIHRYADSKSAPWELTVLDGIPTEPAPAKGASPGLTANYAPPVIASAPSNTSATSTPASASVASAATTNAAPASAMPFEVQPPLDENAAPHAETGSLTSDQARAVVLIKGDHGEGTGFFVKGPDGPAVITDQHVLAGNPNVQIFTTTGEQVKTLGLKGAPDRDLAMISIQDNHYAYLALASDIANTVQTGDEVITPGDSEGGQVMLNTKGEVRGIGPLFVEMSNPFFHGNSGGPVVHLKSGRVLAAVEGATKVMPTDSLDTASLASPDSAISGSMRYFGVRVDNVPHWDSYDWTQFLNETTFISDFHDLSRCLDAFINGAAYERAHVASLDENGHPPVRYYLKNAKLVSIQENYHQMATDADTSQKMDAAREMVMDLQGLANSDLDTMQNPSNFYAFDQVRTKEEVAYRKFLLKEIESIGDKISDLGH